MMDFNWKDQLQRGKFVIFAPRTMFSIEEFKNASKYNSLTLFGMIIVVREEQESNTEAPKYVNELWLTSSKTKFLRDIQPAKAELSIDVMPFPTVTLSRDVQFLNSLLFIAPEPVITMDLSLSFEMCAKAHAGIVALFMLVQLEKALYPIEVILSGIVRLITNELFLKAFSPIFATGKLFMVVGISR